ncbi:MAG: hypothetical protein LBD91_00150 [Prevotellaceae bacterium]|nr:hypothetical protein [Prevotellaceae bacterium]
MKKIIILLIAGLFTACDGTENEQELVALFFGQPDQEEHPGLTDYSQIRYTGTVYYQAFHDEASSDWPIGSDEYATYELRDGEYIISAKQDFHIRNSLDLDRSVDFQIDMALKLQFNSAEPNTYQGMVFGVDGRKYNMFVFVVQTGNPIYIGTYDGSSHSEWYKTSLQTSVSAYHIYTVRKIGNQMSFFLDNRFLYYRNYDSFAPNCGVKLVDGGSISIDYIKVEYIEEI